MSIKLKIKYKIRHVLLCRKHLSETIGKIAKPFTKMIRRKNVVMFHPGRCGSTVLGDMLNKHPSVGWMGEVFRGGYRRYEWIWENPHAFMKFRKNMSPHRIFGVEIKKRQLKYFDRKCNDLVNLLEDQNFHSFIVLQRKNYLSRLVSARVGKKIGKWNVKEDIDPPKVSISTGSEKNELLRRFSRQDKFYRRLNKSLEEKNSLKINYENHIRENPNIAYNKVLNFLGEDIKEAKPTIKKINKKPVKERISNFREVEGALKGTKYEWMLYEK